MAVVTYLEGSIRTEAICYNVEIREAMLAHNRRVIDGLPRKKDSSPTRFVRDMFAVVPWDRTCIGYPTFEDFMIAVAGTYKSMWWLDSIWVTQFEEEILSKLFWDKTIITIETMGAIYRYEWRTCPIEATDYNTFPSSYRPREEWGRLCYDVKLEQKPWDERIQ